MRFIKKRSILVGLIGGGISASKSPLLHENEAAEHGIQLVYRLVDLKSQKVPVGDLAELLRWAESFGFDGFNVTHPYKSVIVPLLHSMSGEASAFGAANTIVLRDGHRAGHNTDWFGFAESVKRGLPGVRLDSVAQIGAGGAGAATAYAMLTLGTARLSIFDIDQPRARRLADQLQARFRNRRITAADSAQTAIQDVDGIVAATPVGMAANPGIPFNTELLRPHMWVADVIYAPLETELLAAARALGCRTINGGGMLVYQATQAFELFTGLQADSERMMRCFARSTTPASV